MTSGRLHSIICRPCRSRLDLPVPEAPGVRAVRFPVGHVVPESREGIAHPVIVQQEEIALPAVDVELRQGRAVVFAYLGHVEEIVDGTRKLLDGSVDIREEGVFRVRRIKEVRRVKGGGERRADPVVLRIGQREGLMVSLMPSTVWSR